MATITVHTAAHSGTATASFGDLLGRLSAAVSGWLADRRERALERRVGKYIQQHGGVMTDAIERRIGDVAAGFENGSLYHSLFPTL
jgi:hypothetical protein